MNQKLLGALRVIGYIVLFAVLSAIINIIPDVLTQLPYVGGLITPTLSLAIVAAAGIWEHNLAAQLGYNLTPTQAGRIQQG